MLDLSVGGRSARPAVTRHREALTLRARRPAGDELAPLAGNRVGRGAEALYSSAPRGADAPGSATRARPTGGQRSLKGAPHPP